MTGHEFGSFALDALLIALALLWLFTPTRRSS